MPIAVGDNLLVFHTYKLAANAASFSRWYNVISLSGIPTLDSIIGNIDDWLWSWTEPIIGEAIYDRVTQVYHIRDGTNIDLMSIETSTFSPGGSPAGPLPANAAALTSFYAANKKPREVSRLYWPFIRSDFIDSDTRLTPSGKAVIEFSSSLFTLPRNFGPIGQRARVNPVIYHAVTGLTDKLETYRVKPEIATQRRRLRGSQKRSWDG